MSKVERGATGESPQPLGATWYHVTQWSAKIEEFTVIKNTSATVWFKDKDYTGAETGRVRQARIQNEWFANKRDALLAIRKRLERAEEYTRGSYSHAVQALKDFNRDHAGELG